MHLRAQFGVERRQRFIQQQNLWPHYQAARQRHTLPLTAGHLVRHPLAKSAQLYQLQRFFDAGFNVAAPDARDFQAIADIVGHAEMREHGIALKYHINRALVRRNPGHILPVDQYLPFGRQFKSRDHPQQRRFTAARWTKQHKKLASHNIQRDIVHRNHLAETLGHIANLNNRFGRFGHGLMAFGNRLRALNFQRSGGQNNGQDYQHG